MKKIVFVLALLMTATVSFAAARSLGLGGAYIGGADNDVFGAAANPANRLYDDGQMGFSYQKVQEGLQTLGVGAAYNIDHAIAIHAFTDFGFQRDPNINNLELKGGASFSLHEYIPALTIPVLAGAGLKTVINDNPGSTDTALVIDLGVLVKPIERLTVGAVYNNIGARGDILDDYYGIGASYIYPMQDKTDYVDFRADLGRGGDETFFRLGGEYAYLAKYFFRLGFASEGSGNSFLTLGLGANIGRYGRFDLGCAFSENKVYALSYVLPFSVRSGYFTVGSDVSADRYSQNYSDYQYNKNQQPVYYQPSSQPVYSIPAQQQPIYRPTTQPAATTAVVTPAAQGNFTRPQRWMK